MTPQASISSFGITTRDTLSGRKRVKDKKETNIAKRTMTSATLCD
jgi:hypothetical protein